jgi:acetylornithine deacetylase/succinyl-diaminopimelate desuccinylase-like protein
MLQAAVNAFRKKQEEIYKQYQHFLRYRTISSTDENTEPMDECAHWLADYLNSLEMNVELWGPSGRKTVFAQSSIQGEKETLLFYGHYDVQPVDPLEEWISPPFEPVVRDGKMYARGACDDKGQIFYTLTALSLYKEMHGTFPLNIKVVIEGEEEHGSQTLISLLEEKKESLKADHVVIVDGMMDEAGTPNVTLGVRGIIAMRVTLREGDMDLHSGNVGGIARNPLHAMVQLLSTLHRRDGIPNVSGFYDEVIEPSPSEKEELDFTFDVEAFEKTYGFTPLHANSKVSPLEAVCLQPTLEINGISGGYAGLGFKTVIPAKAVANISCRLVPKQDPERIAALISEHLNYHAPEGLEMTVELLEGSGRGFRLSGKTPIAGKMTKSYETVFEKECKKNLMGGSVAVAADLIDTSGGNGIIVGLCKGEDAIHAPNESFSLERFEQGYLSIYCLLSNFEE